MTYDHLQTLVLASWSSERACTLQFIKIFPNTWYLCYSVNVLAPGVCSFPCSLWCSSLAGVLPCLTGGACLQCFYLIFNSYQNVVWFLAKCMCVHTERDHGCPAVSLLHFLESLSLNPELGWQQANLRSSSLCPLWLQALA